MQYFRFSYNTYIYTYFFASLICAINTMNNTLEHKNTINTKKKNSESKENKSMHEVMHLENVKCVNIICLLIFKPVTEFLK